MKEQPELKEVVRKVINLAEIVQGLISRVVDLEHQQHNDNLMDCWAVVELMGKAVHAGHVAQVNMHGVNLFRVRPYRGGKERPLAYYSPAAIYCITPVSEEVAKNSVHVFFNERICRICGCTYEKPCIDENGNSCYWVEEDLCSSCFAKERQKIIEENEREEEPDER